MSPSGWAEHSRGPVRSTAKPGKAKGALFGDPAGLAGHGIWGRDGHHYDGGTTRSFLLGYPASRARAPGTRAHRSWGPRRCCKGY